MDAATNAEIGKRAFQVFFGSFFYIFLVAKLIGSENKAAWFKRRTNYTFFNRRGIFGEYINFGYPITWQGILVFIAIYGGIFGFGYWYVFFY